MYCPQCGQPFSDAAHFCKSCGFSLTGVQELISSPAAPSFFEKTIRKVMHKLRQARRRKGLLRGVLILSSGIVFFSVTGAVNNALPLVILSCGLLQILYAIFFHKNQLQKKTQHHSEHNIAPRIINPLGSAALDAALPLSASVPFTEIASPPSITEHTTKLLDDSQVPK